MFIQNQNIRGRPAIQADWTRGSEMIKKRFIVAFTVNVKLTRIAVKITVKSITKSQILHQSW